MDGKDKDKARAQTKAVEKRPRPSIEWKLTEEDKDFLRSCNIRPG